MLKNYSNENDTVFYNIRLCTIYPLKFKLYRNLNDSFIRFFLFIVPFENGQNSFLF